MMISPETFIEQYKDYKYKDLLPVRDELVDSITTFESSNGKRDSFVISPSPEVVYQVELEYLSELCKFISRKYNEEYVG